MQQWYVDFAGSVSGPLAGEELARRIRDGRLGTSHRVSLDRLTWLPVSAVAALLPHFDSGAATVESQSIPPEPFPGYAVVGLLGRGGMGIVYKARQEALGRTVALKAVTFGGPGAALQAQRFAREAAALAGFQHPNIVQVFDFRCEPGRGYFAMELLDGEDLEARLARGGPLDERTAWLIARQAASALAYAAGRGVVHRDVKPGNLFLVPAPPGVGLPPGAPLVKVTDFGLAAPTAADERVTADGAILGTPAYMAPEQARDARVDHRADLYGLGATVFHALSGRRPFAGGLMEILSAKATARPRLGPPVSAASADLVAALMEPDPQHRLGSYDELLRRIDGLPAFGGSAPRRVPWKAVAVVVLGAAAGAAWALWPGGPERPAAVASAGPPESLFDGRTVLAWTPEGGQPWAIEADDEGARVLAGRGAVRRRFRPHGPEFRVTLGLDLFQASACEIELEDGPEGGLVLRVSRDGGAVAGTRHGGRFEPAGPPVPFPSADELEGKAPYLEVRLVAAGGRRTAYFRDTAVATLRAAAGGREAAVWVRPEGGRVRIDSAHHEEVRPAR